MNAYLTSIKVPATFDNPVTISHLLNHSAGFDEISGRRVFHSNQQVPLHEFLDCRLERLREPGVVSSYSTYGIALAGLIVEEVSGKSLEEYMQENIFDPLEMSMTSMIIDENYASWGYEYSRGINIPQPWEYYNTYPATEINSTPNDM